MMTLNARILFLFLVALTLTILPLPQILSQFRPAWVLVLVLFVQCCLPQYFRVSWVFLLGLCLDALCSTVMGEHALAMLLTCWLLNNRTQRFRFFSTIQQMCLIFLLCFFYQAVMYLIDTSLGYTNHPVYILGVAGLSVLLWPWVRWMMFIKPQY